MNPNELTSELLDKLDIRVFISAIFCEMQRERELMVKKVLPGLRWIKNERVVLLKDVYHGQENALAEVRSMDNCGIKPENPFCLLLSQKIKGQQVKVYGLPLKGINKETKRCLKALNE